MTLPALDGIPEKLQALLTYDASSPLIFSSGLFLFLFAGFMLVYSMFRRAPMARIVYVILFSLYFYYKSSGIYFLLLIFAATSDYWIAKGIHAARSTRAKRWLVLLSVAVTALVSGLTIGGKALGKTVALNKSTSVVYWVGRFLHLFHR